MDYFQYSEPVSQLLTYGDARNFAEWSLYQDCGLTQKHIPELIRMVADERLHNADSDTPEFWAPMHAWRALGQLHAAEALPVLFDLLYRIDECDDDCMGEEFPEVFTRIGESAIPGLAAYLSAPANGLFARVSAARALSKIGTAYPDTRGQCAEILHQQLARYKNNDPTLNGAVVGFLLDMKATESLDLIREAYHQECVDLTMLGDLEDVEIEFGVRQQRSSPRPQLFGGFKAPPVPKTPEPPVPEPAEKKKVGRNAPCPCGSGKKYKKCCLNKA